MRDLEFHIFKQDDTSYLVDAKTLACLTIDDQAYKVLTDYRDGHTTFENGESKVISELRQLYKKGILGNPSFPKNTDTDFRYKSVTLEVVQICNLSCKYCFAAESNSSKKLMDASTALRSVDFLIDQLREKETGAIIFFGGEPLINYALMKEVVAYALDKARNKRAGVRFSITTNGTLLSDEIIEFLNTYNFSVIVSIDGPKEIQDSLRPLSSGKGSFDIMYPKLKKLAASRKNSLAVRATVTHYNPRITGLIDFFRDIGTVSHFAPVSYSGNCDIELTRSDFTILMEEYEKLLGRLMKFDESNFPVWEYLRMVNIIDRKKCRVFGCGIGTMLTVDADGNFYPCHRFVGEEELILGNLDSGIDTAKISHILGATVDKREGCSTCWARYICGGGCMYEAHAAGSIYGPPPQEICDLYKRIIELSIRFHHVAQDNYPAFLTAMRSVVKPNDCLAVT